MVMASSELTPTVVRAGSAFGSMQKLTQLTMIVRYLKRIPIAQARR